MLSTPACAVILLADFVLSTSVPNKTECEETLIIGGNDRDSAVLEEKAKKFSDYIQHVALLNKELPITSILNSFYTKYEMLLKTSVASLMKRLAKCSIEITEEKESIILTNYKSLKEQPILKAIIVFEEDLTSYSNNITYKFLELIRISSKNPYKIHKPFQVQSENELNEFWKTFIFQERIVVNDFAEPTSSNIGGEHAKIEKERRCQIKKSYVSLTVEDVTVLNSLEQMPIIFDQVYTKIAKMPEFKKESSLDYNFNEKRHLVIFVHGFMGTEYDMRVIKNMLQAYFPKNIYLISKRNEGSTQGNVSAMGLSLAKEVKDFIRNEIGEIELSKISFVGHSLGGLIIRSALPYLSEFKAKMSLLFTISSPHLGVCRGSNILVKTGMWFWKKFSGATSLCQLSLSDSKNQEESFLFELSQSEGMEWFKEVVLISSYEDEYTPFESSRIEITQEMLKGYCVN